MTKTEFSRRTGITKPTIYRYINRSSHPDQSSADTIQRVLGKLGVYLDVIKEWPHLFRGQSVEATESLNDYPQSQSEENYLYGVTSEDIERMLSRLTDTQAIVLRMRFAFNGEQEATLEETGRAINVTRERVRQIEAHGLRKLMSTSFLSTLGNPVIDEMLERRREIEKRWQEEYERRLKEEAIEWERNRQEQEEIRLRQYQKRNGITPLWERYYVYLP